MNIIYDHEKMASLRQQGWEWADIAVAHYPGSTSKQLMQAHHVWKNKPRDRELLPAAPTQEPARNVEAPAPGNFQQTAVLNTDEVKRIKSLDDLTGVFNVDLTRWQVVKFWITGNSWDQSVEKGTVAHQYKVTAEFGLRLESQVADLKACWDTFIAEARNYAPHYDAVPRTTYLVSEKVMGVIAVFDPHFGMLSWRAETGVDYDLGIAVQDYGAAVEGLLRVAGQYKLDKLLYIVGNDFLHVDNASFGGKGGATTAGTAQDIDSRRPKMFTRGRQALVRGIDQARMQAPVEVLVVPGNHDREEMYRMGEVLSAWYRNDPEVTVTFSPNKRKYVQYGANALMLTHGEDFKRKRDPLPLIMATEIEEHIPGAWAASQKGYREILTGHNHAAFSGGYYPMADQTESRGVRVVSLAGLTPVDAWHFESGYRHHRAASFRAYYAAGGLAGFHEVMV